MDYLTEQQGGVGGGDGAHTRPLEKEQKLKDNKGETNYPCLFPWNHPKNTIYKTYTEPKSGG